MPTTADLALAVTDAPDAAVRVVLGEGLAALDEQKTGRRDRLPLAVLVSASDTGAVVGGLVGWTHFALFFIERVFMPEPLRGQGLGTRVLATAENEARERGCIHAAALMVSFQAPGFFMSRGYDMAAQLYCAEQGPTHFFMTKDLSRPVAGRGRIW
jgi:GNAT superfamily N-acetyltransferase